MAKHLYLPEMNGNVAEPPDAGVWHRNDRKILRAVADGIIIGDKAVGRGVSSVPDVWARPLLVQSALRPDSQHPLRKRVVQEWRGLLSLLALHKLRRYDVDIVSVTLDEGRFANALTRLLPAPSSLERGVPYGWGDVLLVRYEEIPVGAFSPATLVYTASDYQRRLKKTKLSLIDDEGFLAPPGADQPEELQQVASWVGRLYARLNPRSSATKLLDTSTENAADADVVATINGQLVAWRNEMHAALGLESDDPPDVEGIQVDAEPTEPRPTPDFLGRYRVYREVLRPLHRVGEERTRSELLLTIDPERKRSQYRTVIVITPALLRSGGKIWDARRLRDMGGNAEAAIREYFGSPSGNRVGKDDLPRDALWVRPELYFLSDTLALSADATPLLAEDFAALNGGKGHVLMPFTPAILDYFSPAEVQQKLEPSFKEVDGGITFSFMLPVNGRRERVEKTYTHQKPGEGQGAVVRVVAPPVQIFPPYVDRNWRRYYVFQGGADQITVHPIVWPECTVAERTHRSAESGLTARAVEISGDRAFPEALEFRSTGRTGNKLGIALVPRPTKEPGGLTGVWRVGIDFGTSNTNVFRLNTDSNIAERWHFDFPSYLWDVTADGTRQRAAVLREFFVPPTGVELPIPTALRVFDDARRDAPLLDYFIYFSSEYELPRNVYTDFKWEGEGGARTKYFLDSLLFLLLVEIGLKRIERVELICSFPKAFSVDRLTRFTGGWDNVMQWALEGERAVVRPRRPGETGMLRIEKPAYAAEGVAAGEFFASKMTIPNREDRANTGVAAVCLDVGGATTDISIWYADNIVFDASIRLAGRQVAERLQQNTRALEVLFSSDGAKALEAKRTEPAAFAARLNVVLKNEEQDLRNRLLDPPNDAEVQWIRRILAIEFGAIAFYTASLLGAADRAKGGLIADEMKESGISLHWGGNAAKLINWLDFGRYDRSGIASKTLNALVLNTLREMRVPVAPAGIAQRQSPGHKSEAAGGLVVTHPTYLLRGDQNGDARGGDDEPIILDNQEDEDVGIGTTMVCGEDIELDTGPVGHLDKISERSLYDGSRTRFRRTSLTRLSMFVDFVNRLGDRIGFLTNETKIRLDEQRKVDIARDVREHFIKDAKTAEGKREIEPVFIIEVKILLDYLHPKQR